MTAGLLQSREWLASQYRRHPELRKESCTGPSCPGCHVHEGRFCGGSNGRIVKTVYKIIDDSVLVGLDFEGAEGQ